MRALTEKEKLAVTLLTNYSVELTLIEPTKTALEKYIMDATVPVRAYLKEQNIHDYVFQSDGTEHKIIIEDTFLITESSFIESQTSLYRPRAKKKRGDPRIWFKKLPEYSNANNILAITYFEDKLYVINISTLAIDSLLSSLLINPLLELVQDIQKQNNSISNELLRKIQDIANQGTLPAIKKGDTAIGHTLETALGIAQNSSKAPDYKGIELKSYREKSSKSKESRKNLFAQVPNWKLSKFKSSREILDTFGYQREDNFKLYCTSSTKTRNSQGLILRLDSDINKLVENSSQKEIGDFVIWLMSDLKNRLLEKHNETFWVGADSTIINGVEHFQYQKILHTKKPIPSMFELLIEQGEITLDHLIKKDSKGRVSEKGSLFKISTSALSMLFPEQIKYSLVA
ncbi:MvaI/BcnI family restriction endonuclease [thiotrophic endosymbiont of Bathymodiolus puteoserpentis (Logatchev)]|uniref:MvaI/BcnI family restriction endonuclease n=1 Tax=thiotrophic endosymbiont of Bathymodiolus puteoserpentis (Logatchev) TaxID=343240 RepID=UPI0010B95F8B|nr:MvaI/BcnI family restriction endonuclease [thiotrophic endosymbiont of Bathymodiolus puteoserpentis (Logatchev)]SSC10412.1 hypothetical protein BPUTEOSOX_184 [thiotrophic endosymbiont of Bathymodiolus puteoserpentis (Logatchev)]